MCLHVVHRLHFSLHATFPNFQIHAIQIFVYSTLQTKEVGQLYQAKLKCCAFMTKVTNGKPNTDMKIGDLIKGYE